MVGTRRIEPGPNSDRDGLIVVEFALKAARDEFCGAYLRERNLKLRHIGLDSDRRVNINESLTTETLKLKSAAQHLNLKKMGKLTYVYTKLGVVHVKPTGSQLAIVNDRKMTYRSIRSKQYVTSIFSVLFFKFCYVMSEF